MSILYHNWSLYSAEGPGVGRIRPSAPVSDNNARTRGLMDVEVDATTSEAATAAPVSLRKPLALTISCFLVWGVAYGLLDVLNKHFQETLHIGKAQSSWLQTAYFGAYLSMSLPA